LSVIVPRFWLLAQRLSAALEPLAALTQPVCDALPVTSREIVDTDVRGDQQAPALGAVERVDQLVQVGQERALGVHVLGSQVVQHEIRRIDEAPVLLAVA
jgi:hypothetical protein